MRWRPVLMVGLGLVVGLGFVASCALVGGIDADYVERSSGAQCLEMCPGITDCLGADCATEECTPFNQPTDTPCDDGDSGERVCDGQGSCVECNESSQCEGEMACDQHFCVPLHCINDQLDPGETDEDCGGPDCAPCDNGRNCGDRSDCVSGFCDDGECAPCEDAGDCDNGLYCDANGVCMPQKPIGQACDDDMHCASGHCPIQDFICCESACNGVCESCRAIYTDGANGQCEPVEEGTDPDNECSSGAGSCTTDSCSGDDAACELASGSTVCRAAVGQCDAAETCSGNDPTCPLDTPAPQYTACGNGQECNNVGECKSPRGGFCGDSNECATDICTDSVCCLTPCNGLCESCSGGGGTCAQLNATDPADECVSSCCNGAGSCFGLCAPGEDCGDPSECLSFTCTSGFCE